MRSVERRSPAERDMQDLELRRKYFERNKKGGRAFI